MYFETSVPGEGFKFDGSGEFLPWMVSREGAKLCLVTFAGLLRENAAVKVEPHYFSSPGSSHLASSKKEITFSRYRYTS